MSSKLELKGKVFSKLLVLEEAGKDKYGRYKWKCLCDCGSVKVVTSRGLMSGRTKSCGCLAIKGRLVYGVGLYENGAYKTYSGGATKERQLWVGMLKRCYDEKHHQIHPTYKGCSVSDNFKNFQYFAEWCNNQKGFNLKGWQLDKDILVEGNKVYSEDTCVFIPTNLNAYFRCNDIKGYYKLQNGKYTANCAGKHLGTFLTSEEATNAYEEERTIKLKSILVENRENLDGRVCNILEVL